MSDLQDNESKTNNPKIEDNTNDENEIKDPKKEAKDSWMNQNEKRESMLKDDTKELFSNLSEYLTSELTSICLF